MLEDPVVPELELLLFGDVELLCGLVVLLLLAPVSGELMLLSLVLELVPPGEVAPPVEDAPGDVPK